MPFRPLSCFRGSRRGTVTPLAVLSLALLVGVAAIAVDGGGLMEQRRHVQAAADAAALAAASDLLTNWSANQGIDVSGTAATSARAVAAANGFSNDGTLSIVTVNVAPQAYQGGPNVGLPIPPGYVEIIIQYNASRLFSNVFSSGTIPVRARAVARGQWASLSNLVISLNLTASDAVTDSGNSGLKINGGLQVNSSSPSAVNLSGNAELNASQITLNPASGSSLVSSLSSLLSLLGTPTSVVQAPATADPLRYLPVPNPVQLGLSTQGTNLVITNGTVDLYPGEYIGGISVKGQATATLHANGDGTPGIYYLQGGGLNVSGQAVVTTASNETAGVMIYNAWQSSSDVVNVSGQAGVILTPPASGTYEGISIFQARGTLSNPGPTVTVSGKGTMNVTGAMYAAQAAVRLTGQASTNVMAGAIIADTLVVSGQAAVNINRGTSPAVNTRTYGLVE
jgi:hypothetical protein